MKIDTERQKYIRNFSIVAHIDHGKSTLADRILEITKAVEKRDMKAQMLDSMELERERGITIKLKAINLKYLSRDGNTYIFNLIDTPGHVDFTYEVSRSLAACEGAILVVDASQGVEAQTLANAYLAIDNNLEIVPVINKIDLPSANIDSVKKEITEVIGLDGDKALPISAREGKGIQEVLEEVIKIVPAPQGDINAPLKALIFDSYYDQYRGVIPLVRIVSGSLKPGDKIKMMGTKGEFEVIEVGCHTPEERLVNRLEAGDVGFLSAAIKDIKFVRIGDTITTVTSGAIEPLPGYKKLNPMVYCGMFPVYNEDYTNLREAFEKLSLNDASLTFTPETSQALGFGFRVGFLGLLHMDIIQERLEREFNLDLIATAPSVIYKIYLTSGEVLTIENPSKVPDAQFIDHIEEPYVKVNVFLPNDYVGPIMELCQKKRGIFKHMEYLDELRVMLTYEMPLSEIIFDFFDKLKSSTKGYASYDYEFLDYRTSSLVRMDILLNGEKVDALSIIVHKDETYHRGSILTRKLKEIIPRQMFEVPIQAALGTKIVARTNVKALRKDVLAKCYGGDVSRKKKLLNKQKEGKKRMKAVGSITIPQEAFLAVLKLDDED